MYTTYFSNQNDRINLSAFSGSLDDIRENNDCEKLNKYAFYHKLFSFLRGNVNDIDKLKKIGESFLNECS